MPRPKSYPAYFKVEAAYLPVGRENSLSPPFHIITTNHETLNSFSFNLLADSTLKIDFKYTHSTNEQRRHALNYN